MAGISRKLKREPGFHGRLFPTRGDAEVWLERMSRKLGSGWVFGVKPWSDETSNAYVGYMHKETE